jgi:hypothetical protein
VYTSRAVAGLSGRSRRGNGTESYGGRLRRGQQQRRQQQQQHNSSKANDNFRVSIWLIAAADAAPHADCKQQQAVPLKSSQPLAG